MEKDKHIVISLGGSLIVPNDIDFAFLIKFTEAIRAYVEKGYKFVIITGGGHTARNYIDATKKIITPSDDALDWIGIAATRMNAELVRVSFEDNAYGSIIMDPDNIPNTDKHIMIGAGWKPGNSSDLAAVHTAKSIGARKVINLSNIDYVYDKDPHKFGDAVKIEESTWTDFRSLLPTKWNPGLNAPFDPMAAKEASELGLEVVIMNGKNIDNLKDYLDGKEFQGTVIK